MDSSYYILAAILVSLVLMQLNQRRASPLIAIADRWLRWLVFAFGGAQMCQQFEWIDRPYWVLVLVLLLVWLIGETLYNWLAISALSVSPLPLFPATRSTRAARNGRCSRACSGSATGCEPRAFGRRRRSRPRSAAGSI
jgi:hypothetical protein